MNADIRTTHSCGANVYAGLCSRAYGQQVIDEIAEFYAYYYVSNMGYTRLPNWECHGAGVAQSITPMLIMVDVRGPATESVGKEFIELALKAGIARIHTSNWVYNHGNDVRTITVTWDRPKFAEYMFRGTYFQAALNRRLNRNNGF